MHDRDTLSQRVERKLERIEALVRTVMAITLHLYREGATIMAKFDALEAEVARNTSVDASALALIQGIAAKLEEAAGDPAKIAQLAADLKSSSDALAEAVSANTPAEGGGGGGEQPPVDPGV